MKLLGIEMSLEEFDSLMVAQSNGKELVVENGKVIARDRVITEEEIKQNKLAELTNWFDNYFDRQLNQSLWQKNFKVSEDPYFKDEKGQPRNYADIEELKSQAEIVRNEIRELRK